MKSKKHNNNQNIFLVSLGCPKNTVDSEVMAACLGTQGHRIVGNPEDADAIVVNTCGFIADAKVESIDTILEMAAYKDTGHCKRLIVTGCLIQRNASEITAAIPEIDAVAGTGDVDKIAQLLQGPSLPVNQKKGAHFLQTSKTPRMVQPGHKSAYVKIGDGCSRKCAFCAIPSIRGKLESRSISNVVGEVRRLAKSGVVELNLVSQDTGAYGRDLKDGTNLAALLRELDKVKGIQWIRVLYLYPDTVTEELLTTMAHSKKVVPYLDIPLQHFSDAILKSMRRGHNTAFIEKKLKLVQTKLPGAFLRTTLMVGFPGESNADVAAMLDLITRVPFHHLGAFRYCEEEGTPAANAANQVSKRDAYNRWRKVMATQRKAVKKLHHDMIGKTVQVLIEDYEDDAGYVCIGRHSGQAPQIDGITYVTSADASPGDIVTAQITGFKDYDLIAECVNQRPNQD